MPVYKDKNGTWYAMVRFDDWQGQRKQKCKRGFQTKREAQDWERRFMLQTNSDLDMLFKDFYNLYEQDMKARLKQNTWEHKACVIKSKILPYFGEKSMKDIQARDVLAWQNELLRHRDKNGKPYSETYLKSVHNQRSAIFNHAVRYYDLGVNPAAKAGSIGVKNAKEMNFWTKDEYMQFSEVMMDKPVSFYAFEMLYWCGIRLGELLALTPADFDFKNRKLRINKSYQRIKGQDVITEPKTKKSNRTIEMPDFLCEEMEEYLSMLYDQKPDERIFPKRGQDTQNGIAQALKEMGYGEGKMAIAKWRAAEVEVLNKICLEHGIKPLEPEKARGTVEIPEYKEQQRQADALAEQNAQADAELSQKVEQINKVLKYLPDLKKNENAEHEYLVAVSKLHDMLKSGMSILKNKGSIISRIDTLERLVKRAMDKQDKADLTIYDLRQRGNEVIAERDDAREKLKAVRSEKSQLSSELQSVKAESRLYSEVYAMLERIAPDVLRQAKEMVQAEKRREQQQQAEYQPTRKKKSWGLE